MADEDSGEASVFEPRDFLEFLLATDALPDANDPRCSPASVDYVPFPCKWSFWLDVTRPHGMSAKAFKKGLHVLGHCHSIETFCEEWNSLLRGDTFSMYSNLRMFKEGIKPLWEDAANKNGGKWVVVLPVDFASEEDSIPDQYIRMFLTLLIHLCSGQVGCDDQICGAGMSIRTFGIMITVWNRNATDVATIEYGKERLQELLMTSEEVRYQDHKGTIKNNEMKRKGKAVPPETANTQPQRGSVDNERRKPKAVEMATLSNPPAPSVISLPPAPATNPWQKTATHTDVETLSGSGEQVKPEAKNEETASASAGKGAGKSVTIASDLPKKTMEAMAPNKNPWGSPLKSYSWADDEPIVPLPQVEEKKENKRRSQGTQQRSDKSSGEGKDSAQNQPREDTASGKGDKDHPLKSKFSKSAEKLAKIAHVMPVKVSPPPKTKFSEEDRIDPKTGELLSNEEFFYRQRQKEKGLSPEKGSMSPRGRGQRSSNPPKPVVVTDLNKKFNTAKNEDEESDDEFAPAPKEAVAAEPALGFELKDSAKAKPSTSFADVAKKEPALPEAPKREAAVKENVRKEKGKSEKKEWKNKSTDEATENSGKRESPRENDKEKEKQKKNRRKEAARDEDWGDYDGTITSLPSLSPVKAQLDDSEPEDESSGEMKVQKRKSAPKAKKEKKPANKAPSKVAKSTKEKPKRGQQGSAAALIQPAGSSFDPKLMVGAVGVALAAVLLVVYLSLNA